LRSFAGGPDGGKTRGSGGWAYRRKQMLILKASLAVGLAVSLILIALFFWLNHMRR
jgi:hypothetical protein